MRKMKKINGYLIVRFNERELRMNEGTGLGLFGVIDAEMYSGILGIDRGAMEYSDAETLAQAEEQARGLDAEEPVCDDLDESESFSRMRKPFGGEPYEQRVYALGLALQEDCPDNDCRLYVNTFGMAQELNAALGRALGYAATVLQKELCSLFVDLRLMYQDNHAIKKYRAALLQADREPHGKRVAPCGDICLAASATADTVTSSHCDKFGAQMCLCECCFLPAPLGSAPTNHRVVETMFRRVVAMPLARCHREREYAAPACERQERHIGFAPTDSSDFEADLLKLIKSIEDFERSQE